jgi:dethiobiotin synthetase
MRDGALMGAVLFVAGTDTNAGKTFVASAICRCLRSDGLRVGVFKPAETGCEDRAWPSDARALMAASGCTAPLSDVCPYRFVEPLAPAVAAARASERIDPSHLDACLQRLREAHDVVVSEGAGGLLVPLTENHLTLDWVAERGLPIVLVARLGLGTINHTLLSVRAVRERGATLLGTVLTDTTGSRGVAEQTNADVLRGHEEVRLLGVLEHDASVLPQGVSEAILRWARREMIGAELG